MDQSGSLPYFLGHLPGKHDIICKPKEGINRYITEWGIKEVMQQHIQCEGGQRVSLADALGAAT